MSQLSDTQISNLDDAAYLRYFAESAFRPNTVGYVRCIKIADKLEHDFKFEVGDKVIKRTGDYSFEGTVVACCRKASGSDRYVVENPAGILHIFSPIQLDLNP